MEIQYIPKHGPHMSIPRGWIAEPGIDNYNHRFGGDRWTVIDPTPKFGGPTLLLTLDLKDPRLAALNLENLPELPLCSYINCNIWSFRQEYRINFKEKKVILEVRSDSSESPGLDLLLPNPLKEKSIRLKDMKKKEYPVDEITYWKAYDEFLGGNGFVRILGPPIWLRHRENIECTCGSSVIYAASFGYQFNNEKQKFIEIQPFFIGEGALYFFICNNCTKLIVISQSIEE